MRSLELHCEAAAALDRLDQAFAVDAGIARELRRRKGARRVGPAWRLRVGIEVARERCSPSLPEALRAWADLQAAWWALVALAPDVVGGEVRKWAGFVRGAVDADDLRQEAELGAYRAAQTWDPAGGASWRVYCGNWVRQCIRATLQRGPTHALHVPSGTQYELAVAEAEQLERRAAGQPAALRDVAEDLDLNPDHIEAARAAVAGARSLDDPIDDEGTTIAAFIADPAPDPSETAGLCIASRRLHAAIGDLDERARWVLRRRLEGESLSGVGRELGVSRELVRQVEQRALATITATLTTTEPPCPAP